jgi:hypothetical protein
MANNKYTMGTVSSVSPGDTLFIGTISYFETMDTLRDMLSVNLVISSSPGVWPLQKWKRYALASVRWEIDWVVGISLPLANA